jgi:hypothetical protein
MTHIKLAVFSYTIALAVIPISVASKPLLGLNGITWVDPTLIMSAFAFIMLMPRWGDFLSGDLRIATTGCVSLALLSVICAVWGLFLQPVTSFYNVFREPLRLWLNLVWLLVSCWMLLHKPKLVNHIAATAAIFALLSGLYLYLVVFGFAPAPQSVVLYERLYFLRQMAWLFDIPVPRMGGLFVEAPPFGLFMLSMLAVLYIMRKNGFRTKWNAIGIGFASLGVLLSMADQVLLGCLVWAIASLPALGRGQAKLIWGAVLLVTITIGCFEIRSLSLKESSSGAAIVTDINGSSTGERNFHFKYGMSLLRQMPQNMILGIGPGRYGEYAAETGDYPDTVNMQTSEPEILVEWGVVGVFFWIILFFFIFHRIWKIHGLLGIGVILGIIVADSFQANWKYEAVFLTIAVLCTRHSNVTSASYTNFDSNIIDRSSKLAAV